LTFAGWCVRSVEQERYEAIFRAFGRPVRNGLLLCIGTSLVIGFLFGVASAFITPALPETWPTWLVFVVLLLPFGIAFLVLPNLAQLLIINGRTARAIEAFNVFALGEAEAYATATGTKAPALASVKRARRWLSRGEGHGTRHRIRVLIWTGELNAAAELIAGMRVSSPVDAFHQAVLRQELEFVATGAMDLSEARVALESIAPSPDRDLATAVLAFEEARLEVHDGRDPFQRLADARASLAELPRGASIRDRFVASIAGQLATFAVIAALIWVISFA
jgi:hypothetical protein